MSNLIKVFDPDGVPFELPPRKANQLVTVLGWSFADADRTPTPPSIEDELEFLNKAQLRDRALTEFGVALDGRLSKPSLITELAKLYSTTKFQKVDEGDDEPEDSEAADDDPGYWDDEVLAEE